MIGRAAVGLALVIMFTPLGPIGLVVLFWLTLITAPVWVLGSMIHKTLKKVGVH